MTTGLLVGIALSLLPLKKKSPPEFKYKAKAKLHLAQVRFALRRRAFDETFLRQNSHKVSNT